MKQICAQDLPYELIQAHVTVITKSIYIKFREQ